jgi:hypothetical protein
MHVASVVPFAIAKLNGATACPKRCAVKFDSVRGGRVRVYDDDSDDLFEGVLFVNGRCSGSAPLAGVRVAEFSFGACVYA